jgi:hypothetical protein
MHTDFRAEINDVVEDASKHISKRVIIKDLSKQLCDEVKNYTPVFCAELANSYVFGDSSEEFDSSLSKEALTQIFQLYVTPLVEEMVMDLLYWNFPHIQCPEHCEEHCLRCGGFHFYADCLISFEEAEEKWKETRMGARMDNPAISPTF